MKIRLPGLQLRILDMDILDLEELLTITNAQIQTAVLQQIVNIIGTIIQTDDGGFALRNLILNLWIAIQESITWPVIME